MHQKRIKKPIEYPSYYEETEDITYTAVFEQLPADIVVDDDWASETTGATVKYLGSSFAIGTNAFATVADAVAAANAGNVIVLLPGSYAGTEINTANITIQGPNAGISGTGSGRGAEAEFNSPLSITAAGVTLDGVRLGTNAQVAISADNFTITNVFSVAAGNGSSGSVNRKAVLTSKANISNVVVSNSYFNIGTSTYCKGVWSSEHTVTSAKFENNYFTHDSTSQSSISDCIAMYSIAGKVEFIGNSFIWITDDWDIMTGVYTNNCDEINVIDNVFDGKDGYYTCGIYFRTLKSGGVCNVVHNTFNTLAGTIFTGRNSKSGATYNIKYNLFNDLKYKQDTTAGSATYNYENNYYAKEQTTATSDYGVITSAYALEVAYAEYLAQK